MGLPGGSDGKESACNVGDLGLIPGLGRSPGEGNGNPLQYSCLEKWGAWQATVHGVSKSQTRLSNYHFCFSHTHTHTHTHGVSFQTSVTKDSGEIPTKSSRRRNVRSKRFVLHQTILPDQRQQTNILACKNSGNFNPMNAFQKSIRQ